jgi:hypothetical protein
MGREVGGKLEGDGKDVGQELRGKGRNWRGKSRI